MRYEGLWNGKRRKFKSQDGGESVVTRLATGGFERANGSFFFNCEPKVRCRRGDGGEGTNGGRKT